MQPTTKLGRLVHISQCARTQRRIFVIEDEENQIYSISADMQTDKELLDDMEDIAVGDIVQLYNDEQKRLRVQLAAAHKKPLSRKHCGYMHTIRNAEDHISNGIKDQALQEATSWLLRYMGITREHIPA